MGLQQGAQDLCSLGHPTIGKHYKATWLKNQGPSFRGTPQKSNVNKALFACETHFSLKMPNLTTNEMKFHDIPQRLLHESALEAPGWTPGVWKKSCCPEIPCSPRPCDKGPPNPARLGSKQCKKKDASDCLMS